MRYNSAHSRVRRFFGSASEFSCVACGCRAAQWAYDGTDPDQCTDLDQGYVMVYSVWPEFYMPMCATCHARRDRSASKRCSPAPRTHCRRGHEFTEASTYYTPSKPHSRCCLICKHAAQRRWNEKQQHHKTGCPGDSTS